MAVEIKVQKLEEVPEEMREFVTEQDGVFSYDSERAFKALKEERAISRSAKSELAAFKNLNVSPETISAYVKLGKVEEITDLLEKAKNPNPQPVPDVTKSAEYLTLRKELDGYKQMKEEFEAAKAENLKNKRNSLVRSIIGKLPDEVDKELLTRFAENIMDKFALNDAQDGLSPVGDKLAEDYLLGLAKDFHLMKNSTPGDAKPGNATMSKGSSAYETAKANGDIGGMIVNAKVIK